MFNIFAVFFLFLINQADFCNSIEAAEVVFIKKINLSKVSETRVCVLSCVLVMLSGGIQCACHGKNRETVGGTQSV